MPPRFRHHRAAARQGGRIPSRETLQKDEVRLQKYLADCGVASRRASEQLIIDGRVAVDGNIVTEMGSKVMPGRSRVTVDGSEVRPVMRRTYLALNKPAGIMSTARDPHGRRTVVDLVRDVPGRLYPVGRLDYDSEGLLLMTDDGAFAHAVSHPRHEVRKTYRAWTDRVLSRQEEEQFTHGVRDSGELLRALKIHPANQGREHAVYEIVLGEGRNRHIRRMFETLGVKVTRLQRTAIGPLQLGHLSPGQFRRLSPAEVKSLLHDAR